MDCFIGLDIGTSAVKGALISEQGETLALESGEFAYYEQDGGRLMKPEEFLAVCFSVIKKLADKSQGNRIAAICPSCASGNLIFLDKNYLPITPVIGWQSVVDKEEFAGYYTEHEREEIYTAVGWHARNSFPIAYLPWFFKHKREIITNAGMICMSAEYLNYALTGAWGISQSMATPFYLLNQEEGRYNKQLLERFGITEKQLPPVYDKGTKIGSVREDLKSSIGAAGAAVVLGSFDHPSCATGAGVFDCGEMLLSCGTSWVEFFPVKERAAALRAGMLTDRFMINSTPYCAMSSLTSFSVKIDRLRKKLLGDISHKEFDTLAAQSFAGADGLLVDFACEEVNKPVSERRHAARAIIEGAARLLKENLAEAEKKGFRADRITMAGGITNSAVCVKIIAETLGRDIRVVNGVSAGAAGSAMLAGIGVGKFKDERDAFKKMNFKQTKYSAGLN